MAEEIILTPTSKRKIEEELERLRLAEMPALAERIRQARALGDLSENFDYQDAKRQQGFVAGKIADLQAMLDRARIVEESAPGSDTVGLGSVVTVRDLEWDEEIEFTLVGAFEADPVENKIANTSPVGSALLGSRVGDTVEAQTPGGTSRFEVLKIA